MSIWGSRVARPFAAARGCDSAVYQITLDAWAFLRMAVLNYLKWLYTVTYMHLH